MNERGGGASGDSTMNDSSLKVGACPNRGWTQHSSEFYHCNTCGMSAHWMDLRSHSVTAKAEQDELDRRLNDALRRSSEEMLERIRYWRGECPAEDPLPHDRGGFRLAVTADDGR